MKITVYTHEFLPFLGGLATTSLSIANGLTERGHDVNVLAPYYIRNSNMPDKSLNFEINRMSSLTRNHGVPTPIKEFFGYIAIKKTIENNPPDALIVLTREAHAACGLLKNLPKKLIARVAGYEAFRYLSGKKFRNRIIAKPMYRFYSNATKIVAASEATAALFRNAGIEESKIEVVYNGVGQGFLHKGVDKNKLFEIKRDLNLGNDQKILLTVSRLVPGKGQDNTIRALSKVVSRFKNLKLLVVGEGNYRSQLERIVSDFNLEEHIIFLGAKSSTELINYYDLCDLFLLPNRTDLLRENVEGLPNVIYEAASRGKPIIAGIPGGAKEIIENGYNGYIVDGSDVEELAQKIEKLLTNEGDAGLFGKRSKELIREKFTFEKMIDGYEKIILS